MSDFVSAGEVVETARELDREVKAALRRVILAVADTKRLLGIRYSDWLLGAPSIETGIAASSMAQDEWGHARLLYAMLKDFDMDPVQVEHERSAGEYCSADCLDEPFPDWAAFAAAVVVVDGALSVALEGLASGRYDAARSRIPKMLSEEAFHRELGEAWYRRLAAGNDEARSRLRAATEAMVPAAVACFAPRDRASELLAEAGLTRPADELRRAIRGRLEKLTTSVEADVAFDGETPGGWDEDRGRGAGAPAEEAVERARGDLNRALFVE